MTSQVVQRARPLSGRIWLLGRQRVNGVGGILDDLIVTGPNDKEHLINLENNLGVKLKKPKCVFIKPSVEYFAFGKIKLFKHAQSNRFVFSANQICQT